MVNVKSLILDISTTIWICCAIYFQPYGEIRNSSESIIVRITILYSKDGQSFLGKPRLSSLPPNEKTERTPLGFYASISRKLSFNSKVMLQRTV